MKYDPFDSCGLCGRVLGTERIQFHHLLPKSQGGKDTVPMHAICHRHVHATFTEKELARQYFTFDLLREHEAIAKFVAWVNRKDPTFYDGSVTAKRKR